MRVVIESVNEQKKIQAIKCLRAATGLGLKDAKDAVDDVVAGHQRAFELASPAYAERLEEGYITFRATHPEFKVDEFVEILGRFPAEMTLGDLRTVLLPVRDLQADAANQKQTSQGGE